MAKHKYKLAMPEGVEWFNREHGDPYAPSELGAEVEVNLNVNDKQALLAAGWLEEPEKPQKEEKK